MNEDGRDERQEFVCGSKHFERLKCSISEKKICCHSAKGISPVSNAANDEDGRDERQEFARGSKLESTLKLLF